MKDGRAAFPEHKMIHDKKTGEFLALSCEGGMNLRDYFAGQALIANIVRFTYGDMLDHPEIIAECAYAIADSMLAEREKRNGKDCD